MKLRKIAAMTMAVAMTAFALTACGSNSSTSTDKNTTSQKEEVKTETKEDAAAGPGDDAGFEEIPIFEDQKAGDFLNVSAVYFQPVPMSNGNEDTSKFNIHLEADVAALENKVGFGAGDWVPYMTVKYEITKASDGKVAAEGTFMVMSASDGPHYGANVALPDADTYNIKFTFGNPEDNGYLVHTDSETGPGGTFDDIFKDGALEVTYEGWEYTPQEW